VREEDLRKYIQKEVLLTEAPGDLDVNELKQIWNSFTNVFKVMQIGLKSLIAVLVLNIKVTFTQDMKKIEDIFQRYDQVDQRLTSQYRTITEPIISELGPIEPLVFITNPGPYLAYKFAEASSENFEESLKFLEDTGIIKADWFRRYLKDPLLPDAGTVSQGPNSRTPSDAAIGQLNQIKRKLDAVFGKSLGESLIREAKINASKEEMLQAFRNAPPDVFKVSNKDAMGYIEMKRKEAATLSQVLSAPTDFLDKLSRAKAINDVKSAIQILKNSPISVNGIDKLTPEFLENSAKRVIKTAEEKGSLEKLKTELDAEMLDEKGLLDAVKAYQMKNLLGQAMLAAKKQIIPQTEKMREVFKRKFLEDVPLELLESIDPEGALARTVKDGLKKIDEAGKRPSI